MKKVIILFPASIIVLTLFVHGGKTKEKYRDGNGMKIKLIFKDSVLTATMYNNATAKDFISLLPLTLKLEDYAGTEKISTLPRKLSLKDAPSGCDPSIGDITYYSPWGNLAIFYRDFSYSNGLIKIGKIDSNVIFFEKWERSKSVRIELVKTNN